MKKLLLLLSDDLYIAMEQFRGDYRMRSLSSAARSLLKNSLQQSGYQIESDFEMQQGRPAHKPKS